MGNNFTICLKGFQRILLAAYDLRQQLWNARICITVHTYDTRTLLFVSFNFAV